MAEQTPEQLNSLAKERSAKVEKARREAQRLVIAYRTVFNTPDGEKVLADLEEQFYDRSSIVPGDPYMTHAREGAREVVLYIRELMKTQIGEE